MERGKLSYGLNISKKLGGGAATKKAQVKASNAFGGLDSSDDDDDNNRPVLPSADKKKIPSSSTNTAAKPASQHFIDSARRKGELGGQGQGSSSKVAVGLAAAGGGDGLEPSIYDYDAAWDNMHATERKKAETRAADAAERKPRYMGNLLAAAEVRKRDQLRAKDRMIQKDRETEGEEFDGKEKFVTGAYKKQQAELREAENQEKLKEEKLAKKSQGMTSFYRNMLDRTEEQHNELVTMAEQDVRERPPKNKIADAPTDADLAKAMNTKSLGSVQLNDEGQIVDKRQLLGAGLNVQPRKKTAPAASSRSHESSRHSSRPESSSQYRDSKLKRQERQQAMVERQWETSQKRSAESADMSRMTLESEAKIRKTTNEGIQSARERYLERKRLAASKSEEG